MKRCLGCFERIKDELDICPFCGYVVGTPAEDEKYLEPGTLLSGRYLIGKVLRKDYVGVVYTAWDKSSNMKVAVREYLPEDCSTRLAGSQDVVPIGDDNKKQFDEGFNEFVAEAKRLFAGGGKLKLFDCIAENGTAYMIMESPDKKKSPVSVKKETVPATPAFAPKKAAVPTTKPPKSEPINVIKAEKKDNVGYNLSRKISLLPTWVKVVVPTVIVLGAVAAVLISNGVLDSIGKKNATETTEEPIENQITIPAEVFTWGYHSYACFDHCEKWEEAEEYCEALGGHLAVITSQEENDVILTYIQVRGFDNVYIGYSDSEIEGVWRWVNGERSNYTNWNEGEPNAFTNDEDYAVFTALSSGAWNDSDYSPRVEDGAICFMCEWESVVTGESNITYEELIEEFDPQDILNDEEEAETDVVIENVSAEVDNIDDVTRPHVMMAMTTSYNYDAWTENIVSMNLSLDGEEANVYPALANSLDSFGDRVASYVSNNDEGLGLEFSADVVRADDKLVSVAYMYYNPYYGAHGFDAYGATFDTVTGEQLTLSDVVVDIVGFNAVVNGKIDSLYSHDVWELGADHTSGYDPNDANSYRFTVGNEGVTLYFEPLDFLIVELGYPVEITVTYAEYPSLFSDYYFSGVGDYIEIWDGHQICIDVDGDGATDALTVEFYPDDRELRVSKNQQTITDNHEGLEKTDLYLVRKNGIYYLYAFMMMESDHEFLELFNLRDLLFVNSDMFSSPGSIGFSSSEDWSVIERLYSCITDPERFCLLSSGYLISNFYSKYQFYHVGDDGAPIENDDVYNCVSNTVLRSKIDIESDLVNENGEVIGSTTIPSGTYLVHVRTDGETYVDFQQIPEAIVQTSDYGSGYTFTTSSSSSLNSNSEIYRVYVNSSDWPRLINGIDESDCFDGIMYGG